MNDREPLFTPRTTVEQFASRLGISVKEIGVKPTVVVSWGREVIRGLAEKVSAVKSEHWLYGERQPFYSGNLAGRDVSFVQLPVGAPGTVMIMEELVACGAETFLGLGWAGSLQPTAPVGSLIIPTGCVSQEGTSRHYTAEPDAAMPDPELVRRLHAAAAARGSIAHRGRVWSTDAPYRELRGDIERFRAAGVLGVDMETSAMYALGQFRQVRVCNLLVVSDELGIDWKPAFGTEALREATEAAAQIVLDTLELL